MILGYVVDTDFLNQYCEKHGLEQTDRFTNRFTALRHIIKTAGLFWQARIKTAVVKVDGKLDTITCISLAHNASAEGLKLPPAEKIKKLQEVLETTDEPQWYIRY